jgi:hypothetical protein
MSDRPSAVNGKRNQAWGTLGDCPVCGQCLCFGCHPTGPCVDDESRDEPFTGSCASASFTTPAFAGLLDSAWLAGGASGPTGVPGLRMRLTVPADEHRH